MYIRSMLGLCLFGLLTTVLIQLVYYLRFFRGFSGYSFNYHSASMPVSVIVAARNEAKHLEGLVEGICTQQYSSNFELIIVNDRSTDGSKDLLEKMTAQYPALRVIHISETPSGINGKKHALSTGIQCAQHDHLLLTDADCLPGGPHWLSGMAGGYDDQTDFVLGFSAYRSTGRLLDIWIYYETLLTALQYLGMALTGRPYMGVGRNLSYRKAVFIHGAGFGKFSSTVGGDDDLFVQRNARSANTRVQMSREVTTWTDPESSWMEYFNQKIRHLSVGRYYSPATQVLLGVFSLSHIFGYVFMAGLLWVQGGLIWAAGAWIFRTLFVLTTFKKACQKLEMPFLMVKILLMDLLFPAYYVVFGATALVRKKIRWK